MSDTTEAIQTQAQRQPPWPTPLVAPLPEGRFAKNEEWAWARIANGLAANMALYPGDGANPEGKHWLAGRYFAEPDPNDAASFRPQHKLSELFLRAILFHVPWASAPERPSIEIYHALVADAIDWSERETKGGLTFARCHFEGNLSWNGLHVTGSLSLSYSVLVGELSADAIQVDGDLFCKGLVAKKDIRLYGAYVKGLATFIGANLNGEFQAPGLKIDSYLYLREMKRLGAVSLVGATLGRDLQLRESQIEGEINLTGATVAGELHFDKGFDEKGQDTLPNWGDGAKLILRNASAASLAGRLDAFRRQREKEEPSHSDFVDMDLTGFRYQRLGGLYAPHKDTLAAAETKHLVAWLEAGRGEGAFNPDPYRQLARVLEASGDTEKARQIRRAMADHERHAATGWRYIRFFLSWLFIGYGYSNFRALVWFILLVLAFTAWGLNSEAWRGVDLSAAGVAEIFRWLGFSLSNAVPLIDFDKAHETFLAAQFGTADNPASVPVRIAWAFYAEKMLGFVILSYLAAGLSGLARGRVEKD